MAAGHCEDRTWMWHPAFSEDRADTAGLFVHFRQTVHIDSQEKLPSSLPLHITADTRYKLYVNGHLVTFGPVKGDSCMWFYDEVDIAPFLVSGPNRILVVVLRFFHSTRHAISFPRLPVGGLRLVVPGHEEGDWAERLASSTCWESAIDPDTTLPVNEAEDHFLHIYEHIARRRSGSWDWVPAKLHEFQTSTGNSAPWPLVPRMIPPQARETVTFSHLHNLRSDINKSSWESVLLKEGGEALELPAGSEHQLDLEMAAHTTAFIRYCFTRPRAEGSSLRITYSESYEDTPKLVPYLRRKGNRRDTSKNIFGPSDTYFFQGSECEQPQDEDEEVFSPFHFRTFRFIRVNIQVGTSPLSVRRLEVESVNYPLDVKARVECSGDAAKLWETSIRTLRNCMHDCYEDCPFYEQLQYAMDTRSSILFTYRLTGDDRLARQAILQLHNSFQPTTGLTASRSPSHVPQLIPNFSLFWICMVADHYEQDGDVAFLRRFPPVIDAVLAYFGSRVGSLGLVVNEERPGIWNFTDWADQWRPYGIPPLAQRTGISTYTNCLYAYALRHAATVVTATGRDSLAREYLDRADAIIAAVREHCFDGSFFSDGVAAQADEMIDYSEMAQTWAVLSGAVRDDEAQHLMRRTLDPSPLSAGRPLVGSSVSASFYTLRALGAAGGAVYNDLFHRFWQPWRAQLALNVTTWEEDQVSQRSDCHAWGSAPIYEFTAEVAGVRPGGPGWSSVVFAPRLALYTNFRSSCPMRMVDGGLTGVAHVSWAQRQGGDTEVSLRFDPKPPRAVAVHVRLPGNEDRMVDTTCELVLVVSSDSVSSP